VIRVKVDSNYAGSKERKSKDTVHAYVYGCLVSASVKDQGFLAQSSCEAELSGIHRGCITGIYLQNLWQEMFGEVLPIKVETDASAARAVAMRAGVGRVRHLELRQLYIQQLTKAERVQILKIPGGDNTADIGTKAVTADVLVRLCNIIGFRRLSETNEALLLERRRRGTSATTRWPDGGAAVALLTLIANQIQGVAGEATSLVPRSKKYVYDSVTNLWGKDLTGFLFVAVAFAVMVLAIFVSGIVFGHCFVGKGQIVCEKPLKISDPDDSEKKVIHVDESIHIGTSKQDTVYISSTGECYHSSDECIQKYSRYRNKAKITCFKPCSKCYELK